jgi:hypothetical protein
MADKSPIEEYLARAAEAERLGNSFAEDFLRDAWLHIALGYRELAQAAADKASSAAVSERPSPSPASPTGAQK